jgi:type IV pilus assembly protein PilO
MQTGLEGKPWYYGLAAGLLVGGGLLFVFHIWKLAPAKKEIARLEAQQVELDAKIAKGKSAEAKLPQLKERIAQLQQDLKQLLKILPARYETQAILRKVRSLAEEGDFQLRVFEPSPRFIEKEFYKEWPISIQLNGSYHNLAIFFDKIRNYPRLFNIENLKISALNPQRGTHTLSTSFTAKTFVQIEPEPPEAALAPAGSGPGEAR